MGCIIQIKIGDQIITLDPNANISPGSQEFLINTLDINKLKALYANIKNDSDFKPVKAYDKGLVQQGEGLYDLALKDGEKGNWLSPMSVLSETKDPEQRKALAAYVASLDGSDVLTSGNFLLDPKNAHKLSPYSQNDIRNLAFTGSSNAQITLYNRLTGVPGMETLRISIAKADNILNRSIAKPSGIYLRPDNIVQIVVPDLPEYYIHGVSDEGGVTKSNLTKAGLNAVRDAILHELTHAVFSEVYIADPLFRNAINDLHKRFIDYLADKNEVSTTNIRAAYADPHEFLSDMFINRNLQASLNDLISKDRIYQSLGRRDLYKFLIDKLPTKYKDAESSLKDALAIMTDSIPTGVLNDTFEKRIRDYIDESDKTNLFFMPKNTSREGIIEHTSPNDQYDSIWSMNARAYRIQKAYLERTTFNKETGAYSLKDAYYDDAIDNPTNYQIDRLYKQDLVLIPWLRYNKVAGANSGNWVEQGVVTKKVGKEFKPVIEDGKLKVVDVERDEKGNIKQTLQGFTIEQRVKHVPVMYANNKIGKVVVAKVGLDESAGDKDFDGYNTVSIPYEFIKGIRKYNWNYFDHNKDYQSELNSLKAELKQTTFKDGVENKWDKSAVLKRAIANIEGDEALGKEGYLKKAARIKAELAQLHNEYAFNHTTSDGEAKTFTKNITLEDYQKLGYSEKNIGASSFAEPASYDESGNLISGGGKFYAKPIKGGKFIAEPSPNFFNILWQDELGKEFAKTSKDVSEAVVKGDMIRIHTTRKEGEGEDAATVNRYEWLPVYQRVANGVLVGTQNGKGLIVRFDNIDAYAKNIRTEAWSNLLLKQKDVLDNFEDAYYLPKEEGSKYSKVNTDVVKFRGMKFDPDFEPTEDTSEADALNRFNKNQEKYVLPYIKPNQSFVKVGRRFVDLQKKVKDYQSLELVLAKTSEGLMTLRETSTGVFKIDYVRFADTINEGDNYGKELLFHVEDMSEVSKLWKEYTEQKKLIEDNKDEPLYENTGSKKNPTWKRTDHDINTDPRNVRDWYELYDEISSKNISRLSKGDMIGIKMDIEGVEAKYYWRKVLRVLDDGRVAIAAHRENTIKYDSGAIGKAGLYIKYVKPEDVAKIAYRFGEVKSEEVDGEKVFTNEFHQDILDRRAKLIENASRDLDYDDFKFRDKKVAVNYNTKIKETSDWSQRYVPLTSKLLDPDSEGEPQFLNRKLEAVDEKDAIWVMAKTKGDQVMWAIRGLASNSKYFGADKILNKAGKYTKVKPAMLDNIMAGDWVMKTYTDKKGKERQWAYLVDRVEGGKIYIIHKDMQARPVDTRQITAIRLSDRNEALFNKTFGKWKRADGIKKLLEADEPKVKASLDMPHKTPQESRRALYEIGNRLEAMNPDVKLNYVDQAEVNHILRQTGFDYSNARAFVMDNEVFINTDKASVSDVIHEYAHLFMHSLKFDNPGLYDSIISSTRENPRYDQIARQYKHLANESDVNEEVFVTLLGEYMKGSLRSQAFTKVDANKDILVQLGQYTRDKLDHLLAGPESISDVQPTEILNMRLQDVMSMVGDRVINNRIGNVDDSSLEFGHDVESMKAELKKRGLLTETCYG